jgi:GT2 family glycosyltransferase
VRSVAELAVVLCCAGAGTHLGPQLRALAGQVTTRRWELVFVDNGSTPGCLAVLEHWWPTLPGVRVVDAREVRGPSYGRNRGVAATQAPLVLFCDDDDVVDEGWVEAMGAALDAGAALVGGRLRTGRLGSAQYGRAPIQETALPRVHSHLPYVMSCSMGVRRDAFLRTGGFDPSLYPGEDVDLSWRMQEDGYVPVFVSAAVTDYRLREQATDWARQQSAYGRTAALLRHKHRGVLAPLRARDELVLASRVLAGVRHAPHPGARRTAWWGVARYWWAERTTLIGLAVRVGRPQSPSKLRA